MQGHHRRGGPACIHICFLTRPSLAGSRTLVLLGQIGLGLHDPCDEVVVVSTFPTATLTGRVHHEVMPENSGKQFHQKRAPDRSDQKTFKARSDGAQSRGWMTLKVWSAKREGRVDLGPQNVTEQMCCCISQKRNLQHDRLQAFKHSRQGKLIRLHNCTMGAQVSASLRRHGACDSCYSQAFL
ncbi:hypothetical protein BD289DRAFT_67602 [Coniella lustricola]|uniref:Uncharacterized protein n=1 Tax=Coniella lustricola TaxID=2025994 RepID=A0A2T3AI06_9PEZI|nr:hypothetical protein BD289DRAFT_67602 [Coniella lustricola]